MDNTSFSRSIRRRQLGQVGGIGEQVAGLGQAGNMSQHRLVGAQASGAGKLRRGL